MKAKPKLEPEFRIIAAGEFKATCLKLMDEVCASPNLILILTKRGKPVAQLSGPPAGLKLSGPTVQLILPPPTLKLEEPSAEEHRSRKRKGKRKHK